MPGWPGRTSRRPAWQGIEHALPLYAAGLAACCPGHRLLSSSLPQCTSHGSGSEQASASEGPPGMLWALASTVSMPSGRACLPLQQGPGRDQVDGRLRRVLERFVREKLRHKLQVTGRRWLDSERWSAAKTALGRCRPWSARRRLPAQMHRATLQYLCHSSRPPPHTRHIPPPPPPTPHLRNVGQVVQICVRQRGGAHRGAHHLLQPALVQQRDRGGQTPRPAAGCPALPEAGGGGQHLLLAWAVRAEGRRQLAGDY